MSLDTTIADLITAANKLTSAVSEKIGAINSTMEGALAQFNEWRNQKDLAGDPEGFGTIRQNILQGHIYTTLRETGGNIVGSVGDFPTADLGVLQDVYVHFKTPLNVNTHTEMFWFNIKGYNYGGSAIVEETVVGYCYSPERKLLNQGAFGSFTPGSYVDASGNVVLRLKFPSIYYTTMRIDTMRVGNGRLFKVGDLVAKLSLAQTINF